VSANNSDALGRFQEQGGSFFFSGFHWACSNYSAVAAAIILPGYSEKLRDIATRRWQRTLAAVNYVALS
jgi:hypothetical protein